MSDNHSESTPSSKRVLDYSAWERSSSENATINTPSFDFVNETEYGDTARVKIPRSPRPQPAEAPVLHGADGLLQPPPMNAPKGAAAVRHYQVGFGHKIIPKKPKTKPNDKSRHRRAFSASIADQFTLDDEENDIINELRNSNFNNNSNNGNNIDDRNDNIEQNITQTQTQTMQTRDMDASTHTTHDKNKQQQQQQTGKMKINVSDTDALMSAMSSQIGDDFNSKELSELSELLQFFAENSKEDTNMKGTHTQMPQMPHSSNAHRDSTHQKPLRKQLSSGSASSGVSNISNASDDGLHSGNNLNIDCILKLGGSFITNKSQIHSLRKDNIETALKHIKFCYDQYLSNSSTKLKQEKRLKLILIHGAGSFGHFEAKKYNLMKGTYNDETRMGFIETRNVVLQLHNYILRQCVEKYNLPVMSINPCSLVSSSNGEISTKQFRPLITQIKKCFENGFIPLMHGDCIFDDKRGCSVLSGDTILEVLGYYFNPQRCIFWTNVDGVYNTVYEQITIDSKDSKDNKESKPQPSLKIKSEIIKEIHVDVKGKPLLSKHVIQQIKSPKKYFENMIPNKNASSAQGDEKSEDVSDVIPDVTGGMWSKIEVASRCTAQGIDVTICKGGTEDAKLALLGRYARNATVFIGANAGDD